MLTHTQRKQTGAFYTPEPLARLLAREILACLPPGTDLKTLKILDPAAGEGGILLPFAQELARLRQAQEPHQTQSEILQDIFTRQLYAADISAAALASLPLPKKHCYCGDSLAEKEGKSVLTHWSPKGFDIILANPPYIGQKGHAEIFDKLRQNTLWQNYVTPKNDLLYYFFYLALHLLKPGGLGGFITTPYFATAAGGKHLRKTLQAQSSFLRLINFEERSLFPGVSQHTLLSIFSRGQRNSPCQVGGKNPSSVTQTDLFFGPDCFLQTYPPSPQTGLLQKMSRTPHTLGEITRISNGLMTGCDQAFILTDAQKNALPLTSKEKAKLKPFFKNSDILPYCPNTTPRLWLIDFFYPNDRSADMQEYPHLLAHLAQFKEKLLLRKQNNNGIDKQLSQGKFWFGSVRRKMNFEGEKLVLPHRASAVAAAYSNGPWYASSDVYFISNPKPPYTLWAILGLLNSAPYLAWLKTYGKRKGNLLELYTAPLKQLPIPVILPEKLARLEALTRAIYKQVQLGRPIESLQTQLDDLVRSCF